MLLPIPPSTPSIQQTAQHLPTLFRILSSSPAFPSSLPILGTLLAPLAWQNLSDIRFGPYTGEPKTAEGQLPWSRGRWARWTEMESLSVAAPKAPYSRRWMCMLGRWPGRVRKPGEERRGVEGEWALGVVEMDGLLSNSAEQHGVRCWTSWDARLAEHEITSPPQETRRKEEKGRKRGRERKKWESIEELRWREGTDRAQRFVYAMLRDMAARDKTASPKDEEQIPHPRALTDLPLHHLRYLNSLETHSSRRNAPYKMYWNPLILGMRESIRLLLPERMPWLSAPTADPIGVEEELLKGVDRWSVGPLKEEDLQGVCDMLEGRYSVEYLRKGLPWSSAVRDVKTRELRAWVTVRNDLALMAPQTASEGLDESIKAKLFMAMIIRTSRLIWMSLRITSRKKDNAFVDDIAASQLHVFRAPEVVAPDPDAAASEPSSMSSDADADPSAEPEGNPASPSPAASASQSLPTGRRSLLTPSAELLSHLPPESLYISALLPPSSPLEQIFLSLGFQHATEAHGYVDLALGWKRAVMRDPKQLERGLNAGLTEEGQPIEVPPMPDTRQTSPIQPKEEKQDAPPPGSPPPGYGGKWRLPPISPVPDEALDFRPLSQPAYVTPPPTPSTPTPRNSRNSTNAASEPLPPAGDTSEKVDPKAYADGSRLFSFPVHQWVFYDQKMKNRMFPDRGGYGKDFRKR